jgi:hypothetical protein
MGNFPQYQQSLHVDQQFSLCRHADYATSANGGQLARWRAWDCGTLTPSALA